MGLIAVFAEEGPKKGVGLINGGFLVGLQSGGRQYLEVVVFSENGYLICRRQSVSA